jgi:quercetin dioxygenase-like cupin family protein
MSRPLYDERRVRMAKPVVIQEEEGEWKPHAFAPAIRSKILLSKVEDGAEISIFLIQTTDGGTLTVPEHSHEGSEDIAYVLSGRAKMQIEGMGEFELKKGTFVRVPKRVKHRVYDIEPNFVVLNLFSPATV